MKILYQDILKKISNICHYIVFIVRFLIFYRKSEVIFFFPTYQTGGAEKVHIEIVKAIEKKKMIIFTNESQNTHYLEEFKQQGHVLSFNQFKKNKYFDCFFKHLLSLTKRKTYFGSCTYYYYDIIPLVSKKNYIIDLIHSITLPMMTWVETYSLPFAKNIDRRVIIYPGMLSFFEKQYAQHFLGKSFLNNFITIYNGVRIPDTTVEKNFSQTTLQTVYCGRIDAMKRVELICNVFKKINNCNLQFAIYGHKYYESKKIDEFYNKIITSEQEMNNLYDSVHILLMTSKIEGTPMVIMEAMARGVVCISTDAGGISDLIINNETGLLIDNNLSDIDIENELEKILISLENNREKLKYISINAAKFAKSFFDINNFKKEYNKLIK